MRKCWHYPGNRKLLRDLAELEKLPNDLEMFIMPPYVTACGREGGHITPKKRKVRCKTCHKTYFFRHLYPGTNIKWVESPEKR